MGRCGYNPNQSAGVGSAGTSHLREQGDEIISVDVGFAGGGGDCFARASGLWSGFGQARSGAAGLWAGRVGGACADKLGPQAGGA